MLETDTQAPQESPAEPESRNWTWQIVGLVVVVLMAVAGVIGWWLGSSDDDTDSNETPEIVEQWADALLAGDSASLAALYTDDGVWNDSIGSTFNGPGSIQSEIGTANAYVTTERLEPVAVIRSGNSVVAEWEWSGMSGNHERGASDQTPFSLQAVTVFELEDGLIARSAFYYDYDSLAT